MIKKLYLIRHAKSSWDFPNLDDHDRPLNSRGLKNAPEMGNLLKKMNIIPDLMITSSANRAKTTCKLIAERLNFPVKNIRINKGLFHASEKQTYTIINDLEEKYKTIFLFGHNPGFTEICNSLSDQGIDNLPTCGIFGVEFDGPWSHVKPLSTKFNLFLSPKKDLI
jgi:phosphohistidine phosphatase